MQGEKKSSLGHSSIAVNCFCTLTRICRSNVVTVTIFLRKIVVMAKDVNETIPNILLLLLFMLILLKVTCGNVMSQIQPSLSVGDEHVQKSVRLLRLWEFLFTEYVG